jgi:5-methylcytosine-specific restriction protein B
MTDAAPDRMDRQVAAGIAPSGTRGKGPRFVQYFAPVLDALRSFGGEAAPRDVFAWVRDHVEISPEELNGVHKHGQSKFENKVGWARFYLMKAGLIHGRTHGRWALTDEGRDAHLGGDQSLALFKEIQARFKTTEDDDEDAPDPVSASDLFQDPARKFWFAGALWDEDQTERFIKEGVWQNGYDDKFADQVAKMKAGDKIAIKASFVKKYNVPFDNKGKSVSAMRIKAVGTLTGQAGDGKTVNVDWDELKDPKDWFLYTYRTTLNEADPQNDLARRLILFTFGGASQDYDFWLSQPYFTKKYRPSETTSLEEFFVDEVDEEAEEKTEIATYGVDSIIADGCFLSKPELENAMARIALKKNLILQGPPGTGKTWLAKRLGFALMGTSDRVATRKRLRIVQFHPSLSYEDFVRGWRPSGNGSLSLVDGVFLEVVQAAVAEPDRPFVLIIEEINRGNPAQIFGEMLTLLEDSKRMPDEALELAYRREDGERIFIPPNLHVIGTMNIADRSLALVDLALRRRFAFISLQPRLDASWRTWCAEKGGLSEEMVDRIETRLAALNAQITQDSTLGPQFVVGHSYVTPQKAIADPKRWFRDVVETEIAPLLEEYWFDAKDKAEAAARDLLRGLDD